jgi:hypothetical protein
MATLFRQDGTHTEVLPANGKRFTLPELQQLVDGYIERVQLADGLIMIVNEEGVYRADFALNEPASMLFFESGHISPHGIVGNAVVGTRAELD